MLFYIISTRIVQNLNYILHWSAESFCMPTSFWELTNTSFVASKSTSVITQGSICSYLCTCQEPQRYGYSGSQVWSVFGPHVRQHCSDNLFGIYLLQLLKKNKGIALQRDPRSKLTVQLRMNFIHLCNFCILIGRQFSVFEPRTTY